MPGILISEAMEVTFAPALVNRSGIDRGCSLNMSPLITKVNLNSRLPGSGRGLPWSHWKDHSKR